VARGASKNLGYPRIFATVEASNFKFGRQIGFGTSLPKNNVFYQKTTFWTKNGGGLGTSEKNGTPYVF